jgi:hypothetical protein
MITKENIITNCPMCGKLYDYSFDDYSYPSADKTLFQCYQCICDFIISSIPDNYCYIHNYCGTNILLKSFEELKTYINLKSFW